MTKVHNRTKYNDVIVLNDAKITFDLMYYGVKGIYNMKKNKN